MEKKYKYKYNNQRGGTIINDEEAFITLSNDILINVLWIGLLNKMPKNYIDNIKKWGQYGHPVILWHSDINTSYLDDYFTEINIYVVNINTLKKYFIFPKYFNYFRIYLQIDFLKNVILYACTFNTHCRQIIFTDLDISPEINSIFESDHKLIHSIQELLDNYDIVLSRNPLVRFVKYENSFFIINNNSIIQNALKNFIQAIISELNSKDVNIDVAKQISDQAIFDTYKNFIHQILIDKYQEQIKFDDDVNTDLYYRLEIKQLGGLILLSERTGKIVYKQKELHDKLPIIDIEQPKSQFAS